MMRQLITRRVLGFKYFTNSYTKQFTNHTTKNPINISDDTNIPYYYSINKYIQSYNHTHIKKHQYIMIPLMKDLLIIKKRVQKRLQKNSQK